jgi:hypothetical protein
MKGELGAPWWVGSGREIRRWARKARRLGALLHPVTSSLKQARVASTGKPIIDHDLSRPSAPASCPYRRQLARVADALFPRSPVRIISHHPGINTRAMSEGNGPCSSSLRAHLGLAASRALEHSTFADFDRAPDKTATAASACRPRHQPQAPARLLFLHVPSHAARLSAHLCVPTPDLPPPRLVAHLRRA